MKKLTPSQKDALAEQARAARDAEWEAEEGELEARAWAGEITWNEYWKWCDSNPRPSEAAAEQVNTRKRMKRKSKKNVTSRIEITDWAGLYDVETKETTIEWGDTFQEGNLVVTRDGDIGMVMAQWDPTNNRVRRPKHIKPALTGAYVRLLVNGSVEWHKKISVSSPEDN